MTTLVSVSDLGEFVLKHKDHLGLWAPFSQQRKYSSNFDGEAQFKKIPEKYFENLTSLGLATKKEGGYEIYEKKIEDLSRQFAPILIFDSRETKPIQLGNLVAYFIDLFSQQYELVKEAPSEEYKKFVELWSKVPNPKRDQFLQFLEDLTDQWKTSVPGNFFSSAIKSKSLPLNNSQIYVNFIPGKDNAVLQYYLFFPANNQNRFFSLLSKIISCVSWFFPSFKGYESLSFHLGDWERVDLYLQKQGEEFRHVGTTYAAHGKTNIHKTEGLAREVFVLQGGHGTRPCAFSIDLMLDNCDGKGESLDLANKEITFVSISLHHLLGNSLEIKCLTSILRHGPIGSPGSVIGQRFYAAEPSFLEYIRLNKDWQPNQPILGALWQFFYPAKPNPNIFAWKEEMTPSFKREDVIT